MAEANDEGASWPLARQLTCPFTGELAADLRVQWGQPNLYQLRSSGLDRPYTFTEEAWVILAWFYRRDRDHLATIRQFVEGIERKPGWPADVPRLGLYRFAKLFPHEYAGFQATGMWEEEMWEEHGGPGLREQAITIEHRRIVNAFFERAGLPPSENLTEAAVFFDADGPAAARFTDGSTFSDGTGFVGAGAKYATSLPSSDGEAAWDGASWDEADWPDAPEGQNRGFGRGGYGSGRYGMPLEEGAAAPSVPPQGPGPKFEVGDDGRVHLAKPDKLPEGANHRRLEQTHPELVDAARRLVEKLQGSNTHPELLDAARRYFAAVDRPASKLQFMVVAGRGLLLEQQLSAAQHGDALAPALEPTAAAAVRGVLSLNRPLVLAVPEARAFLEDADEPQLTEQFAQLEPRLRTIARAFAAGKKLADQETREALAALGAPPLAGASGHTRLLAGLTISNLLATIGAQVVEKIATVDQATSLFAGSADATLLFLWGQAPAIASLIATAPEIYGWLAPAMTQLKRWMEVGGEA